MAKKIDPLVFTVTISPKQLRFLAEMLTDNIQNDFSNEEWEEAGLGFSDLVDEIMHTPGFWANVQKSVKYYIDHNSTDIGDHMIGWPTLPCIVKAQKVLVAASKKVQNEEEAKYFATQTARQIADATKILKAAGYTISKK